MPIRISQMARVRETSPYFVHEFGDEPSSGALAPRPVPLGWTTARWGVWESWSPPGWAPRPQGWKIHVSATPATCQDTLDRVAGVCHGLVASFKHLRSVSAFRQANSKHAERRSAGKFVTIYPDSDAHLCSIVDRLTEEIGGLSGPYVLTDVRHLDTPIFFRYGAILPVKHFSELDEGIGSIADPQTGTLIPDPRVIGFRYPQGVAVPPPVRRAIEQFERHVPTALDAFESISPIAFSAAGGVYRAMRRGHARPRLLREARPHAGLDALDRDAVTRLDHEERVFADLRGSRYVQRCFGAFTAWEHRYLELEYVEGASLQQWAVHHFPFAGTAEADQRYAHRCLRLVEQVTAAVADVHGRGWCVGDLHPGNVLVAPDEDHVTIIDLEEATRVGAPRAIGMRVVEYSAPDDRDGAEADWYAVARMAMGVYAVDWPVEILAPDHWPACLAEVERRFGAPSAAQIRDLAHRGDPAGHQPRRHLLAARVTPRPALLEGDPAPGDRPDQDVVRRLLAGIRASRRYGGGGDFPGEVDADDVATTHNINSGRAGVLLAMHRLGEPVDEVDRDRLLQAARTWPDRRGYGLYTGLAGVATALFELGEPHRAVRAAGTALRWALGANRCDLFGGLAGAAVAALGIGIAAGDAELLDAARAAAHHLTARVSGPGAAYFAAPLHRRTGLYHGWSGLALLETVRYATGGGDAAVEAARGYLHRDLDRCVLARDGALAAMDHDKRRTLPYLEWGSAGVLTAAALLERAAGPGAAGLTPEQEDRLLRACRSTTYVYAHLNHGRAGIVAALSGWPRRAEVADALDDQTARLKTMLLSLDGTLCVAGDNLIRLSADYGTGAAGVALAIAGRRDGTAGHLPIPAVHRLGFDAQRLAPALAR